MNLWLRLLGYLLVVLGRKPMAPLEACETWFRCWPTDLDVFRHMNNGKYLTIMDLGRLDLMVRTGLWRLMQASQWFVVVEAQTIKYKKSLVLFDRFKVVTRIIGWNEKSFFIEQAFWRRDVMVAEAVVKGRVLRKSRGTVPVREVLEHFGIQGEAPELPEGVVAWERTLVS